MTTSWKNTRDTLAELENLLQCGSCPQLVQDPVNLGTCEHFFCKPCVGNFIGKECPVCGVPSHVKDVTTNRQLKNAVTLCQDVSFYLLRDMTNVPITATPPRSRGTIEAPSQARQDFPSPTHSPSGAPKLPSKLNKLSGSASEKESLKRCKRGRKTKHDSATLDDIPSASKQKVPRSEKKSSKDLLTSTSASEGTPPRTRKKGESKISIDGGASSSNELMTPPRVTKVPKASSRKNTPRTPVSIAGVGQDVNMGLTTPTSSKNNRQSRRTLTPSPWKKNHKGESPLQVAVIKGDYEKVRKLLEDGAEVNTKDNAGWTPLHEACNHGYTAIVELLLDFGAYLNIPGGGEQVTPLHDAAQNNQVAIVKILLERGADRNFCNSFNQRPIELAVNPELKRMLGSAPEHLEQEASNESIPSSLTVPPPVILCVGFCREEKAKIKKCAVLLQGRVVGEYSNLVTHLVTSVNRKNQCPRSVEFLMSVVNGKWVVSMEWIDLCLEYDQRVSEEAFEVPGSSIRPDSEAPRRSREHIANGLPRIFDGCRFYLEGSFSYPSPTKDTLTHLIEEGGGLLLNNPPTAKTVSSTPTPPYHYCESATHHPNHFVVKDTKDIRMKLITEHLCHVSTEWVLLSIAAFELLTML